MKRTTVFMFSMAIASVAFAQSATDAYMLSQQDLRGTARFMSMGGAFGALGGDLSSLSQNPGGIGIYRSNELGFTLDLQMQSAESKSQGATSTTDHTMFHLNNIGGVATFRLPSNVVPNLNFGFTYNKAASFNKRYNGMIPRLNTSLSNYIAGIANNWELNAADLTSTGSYDPYNPPSYMREIPWITILGYDAFLISPEGDETAPRWYGQFGNGTSGSGSFNVEEKGSIDEYNIALGGNISNIVFWGMDFGITSIDYKIRSDWGESLQDAYVYNPTQGVERIEQMDADWRLHDDYKVNGTGLNFKLGVIVKPIQELRIGLAFHTPTYYKLSETFYNERIKFNYPFDAGYNEVVTNDGYAGYNNINFSTPWKVIASVAGVIGNKLIVSADYEWNGYKNMKYSEADPYGYYDPWYDWDNPWNGWGDWNDWYGAPRKSRATGYADDAMDFTNSMIKKIYKDTNTIRIGAEYRVIPSFSIRAGYSFTSSPISGEAKDNMIDIPTAGTMSNFRLDNSTNYITAGCGYKYKGFYADLAYVYKRMTSEFYPFSPDPDNALSVTNSKLTFDSSQIVLSMGFKF